MPSYDALLLLLGCVVLATVIQNLTGFALGLVFLGLVELFQLIPLRDATNVSMILGLVNAVAFFRADRTAPPWKPMRHALIASLLGVAAGVTLLAWLSATSALWLRLLLGLVVVGSAAALLLQKRALARPSPPRAFALAGLTSGLLGGLFATSGPPMVYHMYRQPLDAMAIRRSLVLVFAVNNALRLLLVVASGQFSALSTVLGACAVPVVFVVTQFTVRHPPPLSKAMVTMITAGLLVLTGLSLAGSSIKVLWGA